MKENVNWKDFPLPTPFTTETEVRMTNEITDHPLILTSAQWCRLALNYGDVNQWCELALTIPVTRVSDMMVWYVFDWGNLNGCDRAFHNRPLWNDSDVNVKTNLCSREQRRRPSQWFFLDLSVFFPGFLCDFLENLCSRKQRRRPSQWFLAVQNSSIGDLVTH